jgi:S1-C subfamily serine protease
MKKVLIALAIVLLFASGGHAWMQGPEGHAAYLYPVVRIEAPNGVGSGTIIYSEPCEDGKEINPLRESTAPIPVKYHTYVITNHHVIDSAITISKEWDTDLQKEVQVERRSTVFVEIFEYRNMSEPIGVRKVKADIMIYSDSDKAEDMAILKLRTETKAEHVAKLFPREKSNKYFVFDPTVAVGCSRGFNPMPSEGMVSRRNLTIRTFDYDMSSAQIAAGNSGGAMFLANTGELIGIPSMGVVAGWMGGAIAHMGIFIPVERVYNFLDREHYDFLFDRSKTEKECLAERKAELEKAKDGKGK